MPVPNPDQLLTVSQAARSAGVSTQTVWRWILSGVRGGVRLPSVLRGGRRYTSPRSIETFFARLNEADEALPTDPAIPTASVLAAEAVLDSDGICPHSN